jgi:hypothetical protein
VVYPEVVGVGVVAALLMISWNHYVRIPTMEKLSSRTHVGLGQQLLRSLRYRVAQ